jgi:hypothetical protein
MVKLTANEKCVLAIVDNVLAAARDGSRRASDSAYRDSVKLLEEHVKSELRERSVARAIADNDIDHMREAADILRTMTATADTNSATYGSQPDTVRLGEWYLRDAQKGTRI